MRRAHVVTHAIKSDAYRCPVVRVVQLDIGVWFTRPLTRKILDAAAKNVQHFCQLRTVLMEKLLDGIGLTAGIDCYLGSLRDLSDEQYDDYCHQQEGELLVPRELVGLLRVLDVSTPTGARLSTTLIG